MAKQLINANTSFTVSHRIGEVQWR